MNTAPFIFLGNFGKGHTDLFFVINKFIDLVHKGGRKGLTFFARGGVLWNIYIRENEG